MAEHNVLFDLASEPARVPTGTLISEAARQAGVDIHQPCGGQGRCGRCAVQVQAGAARRRSTLRLSEEDVAAGYALACQTVVEGDLRVHVPPQEKIERRLTSDRTAAAVQVPAGYDPAASGLRRVALKMAPPSLDDQSDDWSRVQTALRRAGFPQVSVSLGLLRRLGERLRAADWQATAVLQTAAWDCPDCPPRLIELEPGLALPGQALWAAAVDIGTTTVTVWLVDLQTGQVQAQAAEYNGQIARGEDVISRIIYAGKDGGAAEMQQRVVATINELLGRVCKRAGADPGQVYKLTVSGNSVMIHLLLGIPAASIRLAPFITAVNQPPLVAAGEIGLTICPDAPVDCLPGVASYVGADISAGVLSSGMDTDPALTLFMDVGTNGETVLGSNEWLVTCACSAGPAFEGAGVKDGMRATRGAIEEVWVNGDTYEPSLRVIGETRPRGLCGSGLISLLAELFMTGVVDKAGNVKLDLPTERVRMGEHGPEYVVAWGAETESGADLTLTRVDIDNLMRAKAAIYAGFTVLAESVGLPLESVEQILIGGSFGKYINVEKAVEIGLLPDLPWELFKFLGNTSVLGAYYALIDPQARRRAAEIAAKMTYIELSADNTFYEAWTSALFLPHTDVDKFPNVAAKRPKFEIGNGKVEVD